MGRISRIKIEAGSVAFDRPLRAHLERRLGYALGGLGDRVASVCVRLSHADAEPATRYSRCEIAIALRPRPVRVADTGADPFAAVENAAHRLSRAIARALQREQDWAGAPLPPPPAPRRRK